MALFEPAIKLVLVHEGGWVNHPDDTPTNYGVTKAVYEAYLRRPVTVDEVRTMPLADARAIYQSMYWGPIKGEGLTYQSTANYLLDMAVLRGTVAAVKTAQALYGLTADGILGPVSLKRINAVDPKAFAVEYARDSAKALVQVAIRNPIKLQFVPNWTRRALEMLDAVLPPKS